ncbi:hypothetical protein E3J74_05105 [Candidatus Bathyarchaeota archaeon]|nr:MAG: hypothetical protein E3J74_05105 [Candidatus Bathyarchaeota archaeon]
MEFDPSNLASGFKQLINKIEYKRQVEKDVIAFLGNKRGLDKAPDSMVALEKLGELIASNNYYRSKYAKFFRDEFEKIELLMPGFFRKEKGKETLINIIRNVAFRPDMAEKKMHSLLKELSRKSIQEWTSHLHDLSQNGKGSKILGPKGRDIYLRDMGYLDRVPIDIHEMRFIIRTGIYHLSSRSLFDPLKKDDLQDAMVCFCREHLVGMRVYDIDLSKSPGVVDLIIWYHCADAPDGFSVCAAKPKCLEKKGVCPLSEACLFSIIQNTSNR